MRRRSADRPSESKVKRGSCVDPVAGAGAGARRRRRRPMRRMERIGPRAARSIAEIGGAPAHRPVRRRSMTRMVGLGRAPIRGCHTSGQPPRHTPTDRHNRRTPPPRQEPCHPVGCSHLTVPDRLTRSTAPTHRPPRRRAGAARPASSRFPCRRRPTPTVIVPPRGVPAGRRQESCRSPTTAPRGRPATDRPASWRSRSSHSSSPSAGFPLRPRLPSPPPA